ncbi:hypothetical protein FGG08_004321 [Glutinoglossum americanum]|uniref:CHAT domain-containing protein n=1 Tax=Glutinoglossum americanum TaxID=1670608 RepID=A0A9P8I2M7_9PEZI|nr:hypothetical protein FGG08_004321 [Glutinoglossum americanum]
MDDDVDIDTHLLENSELLSVVAGEDNSLKTELCMHYAVLKMKLFERWGRIEDLEEAIEKGRHAVIETREEDKAYAGRLSNLGVMFVYQYERTGKIEVLEEAIRVSRQVVNVTPRDHPDLAGRLNNLGNKLGRRYERMGKMEDLEEAIQVARQAVNITPKDHPDLTGRLNNLGNKLGRRYERMGKMEDLEEAIQVARQAVNITPKDHPDLAAQLNNLGNKLGRRYESMGKMEDLEEAIQVARQAVNITPRDHPDLAAWLNNLGNKPGRRYERMGKMEDLEEAIQVARQAVNITPKDHPDLTGRLNNLGNKLGRRYERMGKMEDLEEAIQVARQAVNITPKDHPDLAGRLNNLGNKLGRRYKRMGKMEDLEEAIQVTRQAVDVTPKDHPDLAAQLNNLGNQLGRRYESMGKMEDLEEAIQATQQAWRCENATPFVRIRASTRALRLLQSRRDFESAYSLSVEAINLLPYVHNRSLDNQDQQYVISHFSGLATTTCSLALQTGQGPEASLEVLEQGRGVILSLLMNDQSDTSELKVAYPQLCARYESLRLEVNKPAENISDDHTRRTASMSRIEAIAKLEKCVRDIQQLPGFGQFHKGLTAKQMQSCSTEGSIVVVNVTDLRSDAIIITADVFKVLPLASLSVHQAKDWINQDLTTTSSSNRGRKNKVYLQFLSWLWRESVKPVLDELHYYGEPSAENLPRVWWIGTGLASSFPFHSAGDISVEPTENACYRVISSYTPTLKALQYARYHAGTGIPSRHDPRKIVIITMPKTPGASNLPGTGAERSEIIAATGSSVSVKTLEYPDVVSATAQLQECNIAHFACHGVSDPADPSRSGLILQTARTADEEPRQDILGVREVSQAHLLRAEIAYLSACSTAQNQAIRLQDEVLHVVSGFQVAGFRHVVGCLWPSDDKVCVEIAKSFYSELNQGGTMSYDDRATALALHKAVVKVRRSNEYRRRPLLWAQYVHFGA